MIKLTRSFKPPRLRPYHLQPCSVQDMILVNAPSRLIAGLEATSSVTVMSPDLQVESAVKAAFK